jgi:small-conductance mechanosensitive channel
MFERIRDVLTHLSEALDFAPPAIVVVAVLGLAALAALGLHNLAVRLVRRLLDGRHPYLRSVLVQTRGLTRFALLLIALGVALPTVPLHPNASAIVARLLILSTIVLIGWTALTAIKITADLYLRRFRLDTSDNLLARKHITQVRILARAVGTLVIVMTAGAALMTFDSVRQYGVSLFASAGVAGLVAGLAARPVLANLIAGVQLAITQPIRLDDAVLVENEFGWVEEISATYVVVRLWDWRRLVVPLTYFIEKPFQNWTREGSALIGTVLLYLDYTAPVAAIRDKAQALLAQSALWDKQVFNVQVTEARADTIELRVLVSANSAGAVFDLRCEMREKLLDFLQREHPGALPRRRQEVVAEVRSSPPPAGGEDESG